MASHVIVIDSSARRATIKTTPASQLSEILQQACKKLGRDPESYIFKHNNRTLDLSLALRLSGLVNGAKLELVLSSRSPSVVSIALQLPESSPQGLNRLTEKFPSNTSLWMLLRHFESSTSAGKLNFTERGVSGSDVTTTGLLYQTPVLQIMNREYTSFVELQITLAQLGFNSGNLLIRLSFRTTEILFEEAKRQISQYFAIEAGENNEAADTLLKQKLRKEGGPVEEGHDLNALDVRVSGDELRSNAKDHSSDAETPTGLTAALHAAEVPNTDRSVTILAAPKNDTPQAARHTFNEGDYMPTVDHAKSHQSRLSLTGANRKLLSDAEIVAQAEEHRRRSENVREVEIKFRFPDQMQSVSKFQRQDSAQSAYNFVKGLMANANEPVTLRYNSPTGMKNLPQGDQSHLKLIADLRLEGRVLVNVLWGEAASAEARSSPVLKDQYRQQAREIVVPIPQIESYPEQPPLSHAEESRSQGSQGRKSGVPRWLKLPGKK